MFDPIQTDRNPRSVYFGVGLVQNWKMRKKTLKKKLKFCHFSECGHPGLQSWPPLPTFNMSHSEGILRSGLLLVVLVLSLIMAAQGQPNELSSPASHAEPVAELHPETPTKVPISEPLGAPVPDQTPSEPHIPTSCQPCLAGNFSGMY